MRKLNQKKAIFLATSFLLVFAGGLLSCSNASSNNDNSKDNGEKLYEISGTIAANYSYAPENVLRAENYSSLSRNAITIGDITEGTVTALEAEVSGSNWSVKTGGRSITEEITTPSSDGLGFTIKLTNGNWLLGADCGTYATLNNERTHVIIDTSAAGGEQGYKDDIVITVRPKMTASTNGTVNLTITDATGTINTIKAVEIPISSNSSTETDVQTIIQSAADSHTFLFTWNNSTSVPAGTHNVRFDFYTEASASITNNSVPVYSCEEIINVYSNQETNTWVKNGTVTGGSSIANQKHMTVKTTGAQVTNEANFNLTQECLDLYKRFYYEVSNAAELKAAVEKIILENDSDTTTTAANRAEYKIVLANDIVYSSSNSSSLMTFGTSGSEYLNYKYAVALNPSQPLKISIRGKNGLKKLDLNTNAGDSTINKICGIYLNEKVELAIGNINITRTGTNGSTPVAGRAVWRDCKSQGGSWTAGYITLKNKVLITGNVQNIYFSTKTNTGTTSATAPLKIHKSFTTDSRIGLSFADTSSALETPCIVTNGYANGAGGLFATDTSVNIFFSDRGYNVYLADEITWNNQGGQGYIDAEMIPEITFDACGNMQNSSEYGGAKYDTNNSRYLIGYKDSSAFIYVVPFMPDFSNEPLLIQPGYNSRDFTLQLEYENGGLVPVGSDPANPTWKTEAYEETLIDPETGEEMDTPVQTGLKFSISATDNTIPTGRYKLVATAKYNGNQYTEYWDLSYVKVLFSLDKTMLPVGSTSSETIKLKVLLDEGELKDVTSPASIYVNCEKIVGLNDNGDFLRITMGATDYSYSNSTDIITFRASALTGPCAFLLSFPSTNYKGIKCYENGESLTALQKIISVDNKKSFYFTPGTSLSTPISDNNLQNLINKAQSQAEGDYNIYLMGNALATEETMQETKYKISSSDSNESDFGNSFISINAYPDAKPIKLRFANYNVGSSKKVFSIDAKSASGDSGAELLPEAKRGRVIYIGENADVTFDGTEAKGGIEIKGGYNTNGAAIYLNKNSKLLLNNAAIGKMASSSTSFTPGSSDAAYYNSAPDFFDGLGMLMAPGSFIKIDSDEEDISSGTKATEFKAYNTIFYGNLGGINVQNGTKFILDGRDPAPVSNSYASKFSYNYIKTGLLVLADGSLHKDSYIKNVFFNNNVFVPDSNTEDGVSSLIESTSNNLQISNVHVWNPSYNGINNGDCRIINCYDSGCVTINNFHFYMKSNNASEFNNASLSVLYLEGGTANISDFSVTELVDNPVSGDFANAYAIYASAHSTGVFADRINLSGKFYTDGKIYLQKPYTSGANPSGVFFNIAEPIELYTANELYTINTIGSSNSQYTSEPASFGTIILHTDSSTPANGYVAENATSSGSQVLDGAIKNVKACYDKFTIKLDDATNTTKALNERGQLQ